MGIILIRGTKLFVVFVVLTAVTILIAYLTGIGRNIAFWALWQLISPIIIVQVGLALKGYDSSFGEIVITVIGTLVFYFLFCLVLAWLWTKMKARLSN